MTPPRSRRSAEHYVTFNTPGSRKIAAISQMHFIEWKCINFAYDFTEFFFLGSNTIPASVQMLAWRRPGTKPLSEPMMVNLLTHICVTRPQWINHHKMQMKLYQPPVTLGLCSYPMEPIATQNSLITFYLNTQVEAVFTFSNVDKFSNGRPPLIDLATTVDRNINAGDWLQSSFTFCKTCFEVSHNTKTRQLHIWMCVHRKLTTQVNLDVN